VQPCTPAGPVPASLVGPRLPPRGLRA